jgi:hypothetical protein
LAQGSQTQFNQSSLLTLFKFLIIMLSSTNSPIVVGHVSLNRKKGKRNLKRIAENNELCTMSHAESFPTKPKVEAPKVLPALQPAPEPTDAAALFLDVAPAPAPAKPEPKVRKLWADMTSDDEDEDFFSVPATVAATPARLELVTASSSSSVAPANSAECATTTLALCEESSTLKKKTHRGGRSAQKREEQQRRKDQKCFEEGAKAGCFALLPDALLAKVFEGVELQAVGAAAATGRGFRALVWSSETFWGHISPGSGVRGREAFRRWLFGLDAEWSCAFEKYAVDADPLDVLREAEYLVGGVTKAEAREAHQFLTVVIGTTHRVSDRWEEAEVFFSALISKVSIRREVFDEPECAVLRTASEQMRERALLARLAEDDTWFGFDPFAEADVVPDALPMEDDEEDKLDEEPEEDELVPARALDLEFAQSFLDLLDVA